MNEAKAAMDRALDALKRLNSDPVYRAELKRSADAAADQIEAAEATWDGKSCNIVCYNERRLCGKPGTWRNPNWPTGVFCDEHRETFAGATTDPWERIDVGRC